MRCEKGNKRRKRESKKRGDGEEIGRESDFRLTEKRTSRRSKSAADFNLGSEAGEANPR